MWYCSIDFRATLSLSVLLPQATIKDPGVVVVNYNNLIIFKLIADFDTGPAVAGLVRFQVNWILVRGKLWLGG